MIVKQSEQLVDFFKQPGMADGKGNEKHRKGNVPPSKFSEHIAHSSHHDRGNFSEPILPIPTCAPLYKRG